LVCINDAIKTRRFGAIKRGIGTFVSAQDTDGLGIRTFYLLYCMLNPMTYNATNGFTLIVTMWNLLCSWRRIRLGYDVMGFTWAYITKYGYNDKYTGNGGTIRSCSLSLMV
jgi:hypothetical protein